MKEKMLKESTNYVAPEIEEVILAPHGCILEDSGGAGGSGQEGGGDPLD